MPGGAVVVSLVKNARSSAPSRWTASPAATARQTRSSDSSTHCDDVLAVSVVPAATARVVEREPKGCASGDLRGQLRGAVAGLLWGTTRMSQLRNGDSLHVRRAVQIDWRVATYG
jgi:hypothetical protein